MLLGLPMAYGGVLLHLAQCSSVLATRYSELDLWPQHKVVGHTTQLALLLPLGTRRQH